MLRIPINNIQLANHVKRFEPIIRKNIRGLIEEKQFKYKNKPYSLDNSLEIELEKLLVGNKIQKIIEANPQELKNLIEEYKQLQENTDFRRILEKVFIINGYNNSKFCKYTFIQDIGLKTCPYCNRNYIYTIKSKKIKQQIDHFYPKDKYPILGVSFFNLIPCCSFCNSPSLKGNNDPINLKNPYEIEANDFEFELEIKSSDILNSKNYLNENCIEIKLNTALNEYNKIFGLEDLYAEHRDVAIELYIKAKQQYSEAYRTSLKVFLPKLSDVDINRLIINNYTNESDLHKRPLAKMTRDIAKQLKLI